MKQPALVIIKPDGMRKKIIGDVFTKFAQSNLEIIAMRTVKVTHELAEEHYKHLRNRPFFNEIVSYLCGKLHGTRELIAAIYYGENAVKVCRNIAGNTNPEEAQPQSIRGSYGRITTKGVFENVVHVSSDDAEAKREILLWFEPSEICRKLYPFKTKIIKNYKKKVWL